MTKLPYNIHYLVILFIIFSLSACGGNSEEEEQSSIDKFTSETAQKAVQQIQKPMDKAHAIQALVDEHVKQMRKDVEEME